jgi:hypothetical protein
MPNLNDFAPSSPRPPTSILQAAGHRSDGLDHRSLLPLPKKAPAVTDDSSDGSSRAWETAFKFDDIEGLGNRGIEDVTRRVAQVTDGFPRPKLEPPP